jgi:uncharacterized protein (TIGR03435 family)
MRAVSTRIAVVGLLCCAVAHLANTPVEACTAFCAAGRGQVLVGNNEDWSNPRTKLRFVPATPGSYGRLYVGFDDMWPQGGMNERGLWFDGFAAPAVKAAGSANLPAFPGNIVDRAMAECATVEEVVRLFSQYNRAFLTQAILMFADASGDAVSIEPDAMVRKTQRHFVQTNFHQSRSPDGAGDRRFAIASSMLERVGDDISVDLFRRILAETHQKGGAPTLYSNVYDLKSRTMYLYYFHDFEHVVTFNLADELKKGARVLDIPSLFPRNAEAEAFAATRREAGGAFGPAAVIALSSLLCLALGLTVYAWIHAGRRFRIGLSVMVGTVAMLAALGAAVLRRDHRPSERWIEFSIGPASGESASINATMVRSDGITLKAALAVAFDIPAVRVVGPPWLADTRYAMNAVVSLDEAKVFRQLFRQELEKRLDLQTHVEVRPFEVFVLTAGETPRLEPTLDSTPSTWIHQRDALLQNATMERLAAALQAVLSRPVVDETGITGTYNFSFDWGDDRVASVSTALEKRFGLRLSTGTRDLEALIVDRIRRDATMVLLAEAGRLTRGAPPHVRKHIADILTIRTRR